jgi:hypothetical protein
MGDFEIYGGCAFKELLGVDRRHQVSSGEGDLIYKLGQRSEKLSGSATGGRSGPQVPLKKMIATRLS